MKIDTYACLLWSYEWQMTWLMFFHYVLMWVHEVKVQTIAASWLSMSHEAIRHSEKYILMINFTLKTENLVWDKKMHTRHCKTRLLCPLLKDIFRHAL